MTLEFAESQLWTGEYVIVFERCGIPLSVYMTKTEAKKLFRLMKKAGF